MKFDLEFIDTFFQRNHYMVYLAVNQNKDNLNFFVQVDPESFKVVDISWFMRLMEFLNMPRTDWYMFKDAVDQFIHKNRLAILLTSQEEKSHV
jgi:hypothetical protein